MGVAFLILMIYSRFIEMLIYIYQNMAPNPTRFTAATARTANLT
jgi:hypothetical protein